ncbi:phage tail protein [Staphylococcus haemolyticus]|uniref:phage tail protein n=1 Tax=Staphylococcus haemolyticus TaxID=1283 RepID=UPI001F5630E4|nr:phage tail protein [Staphylococcus haemolyticus]MCI2942699.1 phage tail protein [Staphylococcus haemolyticus]MCI2944749.1 phage tail protein [Staphylococcus haemolyticus]
MENLFFIRDLEGEEYYLEGTIKHEQELNGDERIDMDIPYTKMNSIFMDQQSDLKMWVILFENKEYRIISSKQQGYGDKYKISVTAALYILDYLNTHRVYERIDASLTTKEAFDIVFNDTPYTYVTVDTAYSERFEGIGEGETKLEIFKTFIDRYGYEMKIVDKVVYLYNQIGNDANFEYRHKVNTQDISKEVDASEMYTYMRGYGDYREEGGEEETTTETTSSETSSGYQKTSVKVIENDNDEDVTKKAKLKREYTSPLAAIIGIREGPPIMNANITKQETMDKQLKEAVESSVNISFTADIYDMSRHGYRFQHAELGDRVFLVDERIGLDTEIRVVKIDREINNEGYVTNVEITFGSANLADNYSSNLSTAAKDIQDLIAGRKKIKFDALDVISQSMVKKILNTSSELAFDSNGIHAVEKNNPNNQMTLNSSGLMLSTDAGNTAKTAITAEGIIADAITAGSIWTENVNVIGPKGYMSIIGNELMSIDPNSLSRTVLSPTGLNITRPDGAIYMVNGVPVLDLEVQKNTYHNSNVEWNGRVFLTSQTEPQVFEYFYTQHKSRYLNVSYAMSWDRDNASSVGGVEIIVEEFGKDDNNRTANYKVISKNTDGEVFGVIQIDLGVPTYEPLNCYLKFRRIGGKETDKVTVRSTRISMRG